jgi:Zn-dependent metalloprotease
MHRRTLTVGSALALLVGLVVGTTGPSNATQPPPAPVVDARTSAAVAAADRAVAGSTALATVPGERYLRAAVTPWVDDLYSISYRRTYHGLPVVGGDAAVLADGTGRVRAVEAADGLRIEVPTEPTVTAAVAESAARTRLRRVDRVDSRRLVVRPAADSAHLAWEIVLVGRTETAPGRLHVFVDARNGAVLDSYDDVRAGAGHSKWNGPDPITIDTLDSGAQYSLTDPRRPGLTCTKYSGGGFTKSVDDWGTADPTKPETGCVDAMWAVQKEWDMLRDWLGRNGHDGAGRTWPVQVGLNDINAYWDGARIVIGHDNRNQWLGAMDVVGHEYGHAVDSTSPGYPFAQPGLAEGAGDILGALTEAYANEPAPFDTPDYTVAEMVDFGSGGPLRFMYNPALAGDPNCYSSTLPPDEHVASGPLNHWFYLLAEGSNPGGGKPNSPTCNGSVVTGVGIRTAGRVFYGGLQLRGGGTTYIRERSQTLMAAKVLDPTCGLYTKAKAAWNAVSVPVGWGEPSCP